MALKRKDVTVLGKLARWLYEWHFLIFVVVVVVAAVAMIVVVVKNDYDREKRAKEEFLRREASRGEYRDSTLLVVHSVSLSGHRIRVRVKKDTQMRVEDGRGLVLCHVDSVRGEIVDSIIPGILLVYEQSTN